METELAPIALFVYNRPLHTKRLLESLRANPLSQESPLFIFADGPKRDSGGQDKKNIQAVRRIIREKQWAKQVIIQEYVHNQGLFKNIIQGINQVLNQYPSIIVLEDDLELSPAFLSYMNQALHLYRDEPRVMHINAFVHPIKTTLDHTFFTGLAMVWGWATWAHSWKAFCPDGEHLMKALKKKGRWASFDLGRRGYFPKILARSLELPYDTWDVYWTASVCLNQGLCLSPSASLVQNWGFDGSGHHCFSENLIPINILTSDIRLKSVPIEEDLRIRKRIAFFYRYNGSSFWDLIRFYKNLILGGIYPFIPWPIIKTYHHVKKLFDYLKNKGKASPIHEHFTH